MLQKLKHSPFLLAAIGGLIITLADMLWLGGELSLNAGLITEHFYLYWRLFVVLGGLSIGFAVVVASCVVYVKDRYLKLDQVQHLKSCIEERSQQKRNNIFKR